MTTTDASLASSYKPKGEAPEGLSPSYTEVLNSECNGLGSDLSSRLGRKVQSQVLRQNLPLPYIVGTVTPVPGGYAREVGVQVKICVSWEEIGPGDGLHPHGELWVRVLSEKPMEPTPALPQAVSDQIDTEVLGRYYATGCDWHPDLREDDDETIPEWPHEQWWALPKMRTTA